MARSNYRGGTSRRVPKDLGRRIKKKPCALCRDGVEWVDYKDVSLLRKFMSDRGKIRSRRVTGNCAQHQRDIAEAIKNARELVLLPYTQRTVTERPGARGGRAERAERAPGARRDEHGREDRAGDALEGEEPEAPGSVVSDGLSADTFDPADVDGAEPSDAHEGGRR
jgi:small subunit ribosomal protein S18